MQTTIQRLAAYIDALRPIIYINHFDSSITDKLIEGVMREDTKIMEYNNALGMVDFQTKRIIDDGCSLEAFLKDALESADMAADEGKQRPIFLVLRDIHGELEKAKRPAVIALLKRIAENVLYRDGLFTVFVISPKITIPIELENYITIFDMPLPDNRKIAEIIRHFAQENMFEIDDDVIDEFTLSFSGLNEFQIEQILYLAYQDGGCIDANDRHLILSEKEQIIKKTGTLELVNFQESLDDIGGLENLKEWLSRKAKIFQTLDKALKFGVDIPKGIMITGMPGCGKSLTAKATATLFQIPLVRLDVGRLMGKYVGESEGNMRRALQLAEAISPCVLWIDEIEKAFCGAVTNNGHEVTTRLFGQFLTWMQEKNSMVFIVATANDISNLPAEFLRKGRFDDLFFVDLPNGYERRKIFEIHLKKRRQWNAEISSSIYDLEQASNGFNGADIESAIKEAVELAFIEGQKTLKPQNLLSVVKSTKSISVVLKDKIERIRETTSKMDIRPASKV